MAREFNVSVPSGTLELTDIAYTVTTTPQDMLTEFSYAELIASQDLDAAIKNQTIVAVNEGSVPIYTTISLTEGSVRGDFAIVKSGDELNTLFPNVAGVITLTKNVEIQGTISTPHQVNMAGFYYIGKNAFTDIHNYTGTSDAFIGSNGGAIKLITLVAAAVGSTLFNLDDTTGDKTFVLRDSIIANCKSVGTIKGFYIAALSVLNLQSNVAGVTYEDIEHLFLADLFWSTTNTGTFETYTGTFEVIQNTGGQYNIPLGATAVDISGVTSLESGQLSNTPFLGDGTHLAGVVSTAWLINCEGLKKYGDQFSSAFLIYDNGAVNTPLTLNTWTYFDMLGATLDADSTHRFEQLPGFPDTLVYKGKNPSIVRFVFTTGLQRIGGGTNSYEMRMVAAGVVIGAIKKFEIGGQDQSVTLTGSQLMSFDDQAYIEIRNTSDNDDVRLLSCNITAK